MTSNDTSTGKMQKVFAGLMALTILAGIISFLDTDREDESSSHASNSIDSMF